MNWIEVVDSAVKIGLGSLISGLAAYKLANLNHKNGIAKEFSNKKMAIIESASELAEEYFYFGTKLNNKVGGILKANPARAGQPLSKAEMDQIEKVHEDFHEVLIKRNKARSKLLLLQVKRPVEAMEAYNNVISEYRDILVFNRLMPTLEKKEELARNFRNFHSDFFVAINKYIDGLR